MQQYRQTNSFHLFPTSLVRSSDTHDTSPSIWAQLSHVERSILPVIIASTRQNFAILGEDRISALAGVSRRSVKSATDRLASLGLISISRHTSPRMRDIKGYTTSLDQNSRSIAIYGNFIYSGLWAKLGKSSPSSQAVYIAMRCLADLRPDLDNDGTWPQTQALLNEYILTRERDFCLAPMTRIARFSGVSRKSCFTAINTLIDYQILGRLDYGYSVVIDPIGV